MTDVRTLLRAASPPPPPTLGLNRVLAAARQRQQSRRRRFWLWTTGLLVLGVGGPLSGALVYTSPSPTRVEIARPVPGDGGRPTTSLPVPVGGARSPSRQPAARQVDAAPTGEATATRPSATPPAEGCRVDRRSTSNLQLSETGEGGGGWEQYPSCGYTATVAGGYVAKGSWRIEILRGGTTLTIDSARAPSCGTNVIQPGDEVTAYTRKGVNSPDDWFVAVGANERC